MYKQTNHALAVFEKVMDAVMDIALQRWNKNKQNLYKKV